MNMSAHTQPFSSVGQGGIQMYPGASAASAAVRHCLVSLLTISTESGGGGFSTPAGLAHSVGVAFLEMTIMARGAKKTAAEAAQSGLPRFVDVRLTAEEKVEFLRWNCTPTEAVQLLQDLCDDGYRVGCSWSGDSQAYTVSLTCRNPDSPNNGLCMTSFAKELHTAVGLAVYKHTVLTDGTWISPEVSAAGDFG